VLQYAPDDINTDEKKQDVFLNVLNDDIQFQLLNTDYADFQHMVDKAIVVGNKIREMEKDGKRKVPFFGQSSRSNVRPRFSQPNQFFKPPQMNRMQMPMQMQRPQFQMQRLEYQMRKPSAPLQRTSQQPNRQGGQMQPRQNQQPVPRPSAQPSHSAQNQGGQGFGPCFKCGMSGNLARQCPNKPSVTGAGSQL
jgi:hypothetical protein